MNDNEPTWAKPCQTCGATVERWHGQTDVDCHRCGTSYNAFGQRLRDDWRGNPAWSDEDTSDMEGFEVQQLRRDM